MTGATCHIPNGTPLAVRSGLALGSVLALWGCGEALHTGWIGRVADRETVTMDGRNFVAEYLPLKSPPCGTAQDVRPKGRDLGCIMDSGIPVVRVSAATGALGSSDYDAARRVAATACARNPDWTQAAQMPPAAVWGDGDMAFYRDTAALTGGAWEFYAGCL